MRTLLTLAAFAALSLTAPTVVSAGEVLARATVPVAVPHRHVAPADAALSEQDVRDWLLRLETAWEAKDVAALQDLGVVRPGFEGRLTQALAPYKELQVVFSNEAIFIDGPSASLSFDRMDTDEYRQRLQHPRQTFQLERTVDGDVTARLAPR